MQRRQRQMVQCAVFLLLCLIPFSCRLVVRSFGGCEIFEEAQSIASPNGEWVATLRGTDCSDGWLTTDAFYTVALALSSAPQQRTDLFSFDAGEPQADHPSIAWLNDRRLGIRIFGHPLVGRNILKFHDVELEPEFGH